MLFANKTNKNSLCAFGFYDDGVCFVRVSQKKNSKPTVEALEFCSGDPGVHPLLLKQLLKSQKLKNLNCTTFLKSKDYQFLSTTKPEVPDEDLVNVLQWEIKDLLAQPIENVTIDTFYEPDYGIEKKNINIVSANKEKIADVAKTFEEAKLKLSIIDIEEMALRNLAILDAKEKLGLVTLWLDADYAKVLFFSGENLHLTRNIEKGYNAIANSITGMDDIALEVQRSIDYFERHFNQIPISNLVLMPMGLESSGFIDFLNKNLSLPCHEFDIKNEVNGLDEIDQENIARFLLTVGSGLRQQKGEKNAAS